MHSRTQTFTFRSALPIGAGLGSSAAFSVCTSAALLYTLSLLSLPTPSPGTEGHHDGRLAVPPTDATLVNSWAFTSEKILHGNPSGVDNSVATHGGAVAFTKSAGAHLPASIEPLHGFKKIRFLITDTKVPRDTKTLVAGVAARKHKEPDFVGGVLRSIQAVSDEARRCLSDPEMDRKEQVQVLERLVDRNHELVTALGVGHEALERVRAKTAEKGLRTKLTGAGGGGCAVTIVPDGESLFNSGGSGQG